MQGSWRRIWEKHAGARSNVVNFSASRIHHTRNIETDIWISQTTGNAKETGLAERAKALCQFRLIDHLGIDSHPLVVKVQFETRNGCR
jgi:hypothetical protein